MEAFTSTVICPLGVYLIAFSIRLERHSCRRSLSALTYKTGDIVTSPDLDRPPVGLYNKFKPFSRASLIRSSVALRLISIAFTAVMRFFSLPSSALLISSKSRNKRPKYCADSCALLIYS